MYWIGTIVKRVMDDPVIGKLSSVGAAWLTAGTFGGFGFANGGEYAWYAFGIYLIPVLIVAAVAYKRGRRIRENGDATFDQMTK